MSCLRSQDLSLLVAAQFLRFHSNRFLADLLFTRICSDSLRQRIDFLTSEMNNEEKITIGTVCLLSPEKRHYHRPHVQVYYII